MALELQSVIHKEGHFDKFGTSISTQQELIYIYKKLYDIRMGFTFTHSTKTESRLLFPQIIYKDIHVHRNQIYYFLKKLIQNVHDSVLIENEDLQDLIEKEILVDMQYLLIYYHMFSEKSSLILTSIGYLLQPLFRLVELFSEGNLKKEISKQFNINSKYDCFERINKINDSIEDFISEVNKKKNFSLKHPILLLIHANYITMKRVLGGDVRHYNHIILYNILLFNSDNMLNLY